MRSAPGPAVRSAPGPAVCSAPAASQMRAVRSRRSDGVAAARVGAGSPRPARMSRPPIAARSRRAASSPLPTRSRRAGQVAARRQADRVAARSRLAARWPAPVSAHPGALAPLPDEASSPPGGASPPLPSGLHRRDGAVRGRPGGAAAARPQATSSRAGTPPRFRLPADSASQARPARGDTADVRPPSRLVIQRRRPRAGAAQPARAFPPRTEAAAQRVRCRRRRPRGGAAPATTADSSGSVGRRA